MEYAALNTKIYAMYSRFLQYTDFEELSSMKTVYDVGRRIKGFKGYANVLQGLEGKRLRRSPIERNLIRSLFDDYERIHKFATDSNFRGYLDAFFMDNEIEIIKMILCMVLDERTDEYLAEEYSIQINGKYMPDMARLVKSKNMGDFIENLNGTRYYKPLIQIYGRDTTVFQLEMQLDLFYYMNLWEQCRRFTGKERKAIEHIIGTQIDLRNIMWVYRFKRYYSLEPELIYAFLIPIHYKLKASDINALVVQKNLETQDVLDEALIPQYRNVFRESTTLEFDYYKKMSEIYRTARKENKSSVISAISYIFFKELEINNLTTLIEGIRYQLKPKEIMRHLYFPDGAPPNGEGGRTDDKRLRQAGER